MREREIVRREGGIIAKHFKSSEDEAKLRALLEPAGISSNARKAHVVLSILLQALATREIEIHGEDLLLEYSKRSVTRKPSYKKNSASDSGM